MSDFSALKIRYQNTPPNCRAVIDPNAVYRAFSKKMSGYGSSLNRAISRHPVFSYIFTASNSFLFVSSRNVLMPKPRAASSAVAIIRRASPCPRAAGAIHIRFTSAIVPPVPLIPTHPTGLPCICATIKAARSAHPRRSANMRPRYRRRNRRSERQCRHRLDLPRPCRPPQGYPNQALGLRLLISGKQI